MKKRRWQIFLGISLILLSLFGYIVHYLVFSDSHHIFIYFLGDLAFVPIEVLLVTLIIHRMLESREKRALFKKLNMVIGAFFSEVGTGLIKQLSLFCTDGEKIRSLFLVDAKWNDKDFDRAQKLAGAHDFCLDSRKDDCVKLRAFLLDKRQFLLDLLRNPNLLEHESFTDLLWAVTHLSEELEARTQFDTLPDSDLDHLSLDMKRAYSRLIAAWLDYMIHLKSSYPYLFSLAIRLNPLKESTSVIIS